MSGFSFKSGKSVAQMLADVRVRAEKDADRALDAGADVLLAQVRVELSRPGLGRLNARTHRARPGDPPLRQSGALLASARVETPRPGVRRVVVGGPDAPYSAVQEFGSRTQPPHPFMRPALRHARGRMGAQIIATLKKGR